MNKSYVFVSGAAGGIGKKTASLLVSRGFHVFAGDINPNVSNIFSSPAITPIELDITDPLSVQKAVQHIQSVTTNLHGLVNIAGVFDQFPLAEVRMDSFEKLLNTNLIGSQRLTNALFPFLYKMKGKVINLSSEMVLAQMPLQAYGFSKKLFDIWNTQLRMELKLLGMKVIVIRAGGHKTPFIDLSSKIIEEFDTESRYANLMSKIKIQGQHVLQKTKADPLDIAKIIYKALVCNRPKNTYYVNTSLLFKTLSIFPLHIREQLIHWQLKKWI